MDNLNIGAHQLIDFITLMDNKIATILSAFQEALDFWGLEIISGQILVPPASVDDPLEELVKLIKLIRAHTTRVGIIFEPSKLKKQTDAAYNTVSELSKSFVLYMSALAQLSPEKISNLFYQEIVKVSGDLVATASKFGEELKKLEELEADNEDEIKENEVNPRLVSVGKVWSLCDDIVKLILSGNLKFLELKTKMHLTLIEDGLDEFEEWTENPEDVGDDPFGFDDDFSDDEETKVPAADSEEEEEEPKEDKQALVAYSKQWLQKLKFVKLLFLSINKSLPTIPAGSDIDDIYRAESTILREVDKLIVDLMMNQVLDEDVEDHASNIDKACYRIVAIVRNASKNNEAKVKWCGSWETKYKELLEGK